MELFMEGNKIYLHRSWTGICCYILELYDNDEKIYVTANNNPKEQKFNNNDGSDDFYQRIIDEIYQIIEDRLDLGKYMFNPQKTESEEKQPNDCIFERDDDFEQAVKEGRAVKYDAPDDTDSIN